MLAKRFDDSSSAQSTSTVSTDYLLRNVIDFQYDPDAGVTFESWYKRYEDIFTVDLAAQQDDVRVRLLLRKLAPTEHVRYTNYVLPADPKSLSFPDTIEKLTRVFGDTASLFNTRFNCLQLTKRDTDDLITYGGLVNRECGRFKLGSLTEDQFRCLIFICGLQSPAYSELRTRLLAKIEQEPSLTLQQLIDECDRLHNLKRDSALIQRPDRSFNPIHAITTKPRQNYSPTGTTVKKPPSPCRHCGAWHFHKDCPFRNNRCQKCHVVGHKDGHCRSVTVSHNRQTKHKPAGNILSLLAAFQVNAADRRKYVTVHINGIPARLQLDTASDITIISHSLWTTLGSPDVQPSTQSATSACGGTVKLTGQLNCTVAFGESTRNTMCFVSNSDLNLLGLDWCEQLNLMDLPINSICNTIRLPLANLTDALTHKFKDVFQEGLGLCSKSKASLKLRPGSRPVFRPKRPVPYAAVNLVDDELKRLEDLGVLVPVNYSRWAAPVVVVKKSNGSIRLCADFSTGLNAALESNCYPLPVPEDIFTMLNGGSCFAKLDLSEAYLQMEVDAASKELLTINTHRGLFQFTRLPFGVKTAPAIFQQLMDILLAGIPGSAWHHRNG